MRYAETISCNARGKVKADDRNVYLPILFTDEELALTVTPWIFLLHIRAEISAPRRKKKDDEGV